MFKLTLMNLLDRFQVKKSGSLDLTTNLNNRCSKVVSITRTVTRTVDTTRTKTVATTTTEVEASRREAEVTKVEETKVETTNLSWTKTTSLQTTWWLPNNSKSPMPKLLKLDSLKLTSVNSLSSLTELTRLSSSETRSFSLFKMFTVKWQERSPDVSSMVSLTLTDSSKTRNSFNNRFHKFTTSLLLNNKLPM